MRAGLGVLIFAAFVMTIGACTKRAAETWQKPGTTQGDWNSDKINCRSLARRKVDREYRAEASQVGSDEYRVGTTLSRTMKRYDAKKREQALFENCLKSRGFKKSIPGGGKATGKP